MKKTEKSKTAGKAGTSKSRLMALTARSVKWDYSDSLPGRFEALLKSGVLSRCVAKGDAVAVKLHFGSQGAYRTIRPVFARQVVDAVKALGAEPFVCDTVRIAGPEYLRVAASNGFTPQGMGCPVILADGLFGKDNVKVDAGKPLGKIGIASAVFDADAMIVLSHCKGHIQAGYGGAIKNLAMGCVSADDREKGWREARGRLHAAHGSDLPVWNPEICTLCRQCEHVCPRGALTFDSRNNMKIDEKKCWKCMRCARVCPSGGLKSYMAKHDFHQALALSAKAVSDAFGKSKIYYLNFLMDVQPECDCMPSSDLPLVQDWGILAGADPVAIDQASWDIINSSPILPNSLAADRKVKPGTNILIAIHDADAAVHFKMASELGLGSVDYQIKHFTYSNK